MGTEESNRGQPHRRALRRQSTVKTPKRAVLTEEDGAVYVEYISIVLLVGILASAALILVGVPVLQNFQNTQLFLLAPLP